MSVRFKRVSGGCRRLFLAVSVTFAILSDPVWSASIQGVILDANQDQPVAGAAIQLKGTAIGALSQSDGTFAVSGIPAGRCEILVSRIGYHPTQARGTASDSGGQQLVIYLSPRPVEIGAQVVVARHSQSKFEELAELSHTLDGRRLQRELGNTLAATLRNETGLAMRSMGPAPARPVIRGLGGDRVTIAEDGGKTTDLSATSPDHAVTIEPFTIESVELVRGPKVLMYSSTTLGGVVNVERHEIPVDPRDNITGSVGLFAESTCRGLLTSTQLTVPTGGVLLRGEVNKKRTSDLRTPAGTLNNSQSENLDWSLGGSIHGRQGYIGASFRKFGLDYGVPGGFVGAHPNGVDIEMDKHQLNITTQADFGSSFLDDIEVLFTRAYYRHKEFEAKNVIGTEFKIVNYLGHVNLRHQKSGSLDGGTLGVSYEFRDQDFGGLVFSPPSKSANLAAYWLESLSFSKLSIESGLRYEYARIRPDHYAPDSRIGRIRQREFHTYSASASLLCEASDIWSVGVNVSRSSRIPTLEELFSEGPHLAAYSFETGNPDLAAETGMGTEVFSYLKSGKLYLMESLFYNRLNHYIIHRNTGQINWTTVLPIYAAEGVPATLYGLESQLGYQLTSRINLSGSLSLVRGEFRDAGTPLPQIPPTKGQIEAKYTDSRLTLGLITQFASRQMRVDRFEEPTDGYFVYNAFAQYILSTRSCLHSVSLSLDNIFDVEYRNHLSRVKSVMPEAGRNLRAIYKLNFEM